MRFITNAQTFACASPLEIVSTLAHAFSQPFESPERMHCDLPGGDDAKLLVMPAWQDRSAIGVKIATVMPANSQNGLPTVDGVYILMDGKTGQIAAILEAPALTALRTAGVSALASQFLSRENSKTLLVVGTGALAPHMARAHSAVRKLETIMIWGRNPVKAKDTAAKLSDLDKSIKIEVVSDLAQAVRRADIVSCATLSTEALIFNDWVQPGTHLDFVGSFTPTMCEADPEIFARARVVIDTPTALKESGDLIAPQKMGLIPDQVPELSDLIGKTAPERINDREITLFKSVGTGLSDIAIARYIADKLSADNVVHDQRVNCHG